MSYGSALPSAPRGASRNSASKAARIRIKGTGKGLSITLGEGDWLDLLSELDRRLALGEGFFGGGQVNLSIGQRDISQPQLEQLVEILARYKIELQRLHTSSRVAAEAGQALGVRLGLPEPERSQPARPVPKERGSNGLLLHRTVRSGQSLRQPGHIVIVGDVHAGAEVIAGGDVVVWGRVHGMVHAGATGNDQAVVCALELRPTQLRIAGYIATSPREGQNLSIGPEVASVVDGQIVARPWTSK
jgi:septum site-determining protein MinC